MKQEVPVFPPAVDTMLASTSTLHFLGTTDASPRPPCHRPGHDQFAGRGVRRRHVRPARHAPSRRSNSTTRRTAGSSTSRKTSGTRSRRTVREALANSGREREDVAAIGITNQRETVVVWDRATGRPVHRAIVWQDRRTTDFCRAARRRPADAHREDRPRARPVLLRHEAPLAAAEQTPTLKASRGGGELACGTIDSFLIWRLTGGARHATDATNASRTLLFNIHTMQWDDELLRYFGVPRALLPEVKPSAAEFGVTKGLDFLPDGIPIRGVAGDQQAALFGQGCFGPGEAKCTYGTGAFFLLHTGDSRGRRRSTSCSRPWRR